MKEKLYQFLVSRLLYSVSTRKHIYQTLQEIIPFADINVLNDIVTITFNKDVVTFEFDFEERDNNLVYLKNIDLS